jgi:hypothetical protein
VSFNPVLDGLLELLDEGSRLNTEPANVDLVAHLANGVLDLSEEGDLLVKDLKRRESSYDTVENLLRHVVKVEDLIFDTGIFAILTCAGKLELLAEDLLEGFARVEEVLEADREFFFPKELLVIILLEEVVGSLLNLVEVTSDVLELSHEQELVLDFVQEITVSGIKTRHLGGKRDEVLNNLVDDVTNTVLTVVANNGWLKEHVVSLKVDLDVEDGLKTVVLVVFNGELVEQVLHRAVDTFSDTGDYETVKIVDVASPGS